MQPVPTQKEKAELCTAEEWKSEIKRNIFCQINWERNLWKNCQIKDVVQIFSKGAPGAKQGNSEGTRDPGGCECSAPHGFHGGSHLRKVFENVDPHRTFPLNQNQGGYTWKCKWFHSELKNSDQLRVLNEPVHPAIAVPKFSPPSKC